MNDLDVLAGFRADVPGPDAAALTHARSAMFGTPPAAGARRSSWRWATVTGLAAAAIIGVVAIVAVRPAPPELPAGADGARSVLRLAAGEARGATPLAPRGDQFLFIESVTAVRGRPAGDGGIPPMQAQGLRIWVSADRSRDGLVRQRATANSGPWLNPSVERWNWNFPTTPEDRGLPRCDGPPPCGVEPAYLPDLPADVAGMRALIYRRAGTENPDRAAFHQIRLLLTLTAMPPARLAALYGVVTTIPGLTVVPDAVDAAGRHGVGVTLAPGSGDRDELIFDRTSHQLLGGAQVLTTARGGLPAGTAIMATARLRTAIVDRAGELPR
jgi:hypothetical protein